MPDRPVIRVMRAGDTSKPNPFTIAIIANPALEVPWNSGNFRTDPICGNHSAFDRCAAHINTVLFGGLPQQREKFVADPSVGPKIRVVSLFVARLPPTDANSLVGESQDLLVARRTRFRPFLQRFGIDADVAYAVSLSPRCSRASAWYTTDDESSGGVPFSWDGGSYLHCYEASILGTVAIHQTAASLTALHEFGHALSSYTNGSVDDLYVDSPPALNVKSGRPIPQDFADYEGTTMASDAVRDGLGYPAGWVSYHCELLDPTMPAVMDDYRSGMTGVSEHCRHDRITRAFLLDRLRSKTSR